MNSQKYIETLETALGISVSIVFGDTSIDIKFQQDSAPCYKCADSMARLIKNGVDLLKNPSQSPNLNPIVNIITEKRME